MSVDNNDGREEEKRKEEEEEEEEQEEEEKEVKQIDISNNKKIYFDDNIGDDDKPDINDDIEKLQLSQSTTNANFVHDNPNFNDDDDDDDDDVEKSQLSQSKISANSLTDYNNISFDDDFNLDNVSGVDKTFLKLFKPKTKVWNFSNNERYTVINAQNCRTIHEKYDDDDNDDDYDYDDDDDEDEEEEEEEEEELNVETINLQIGYSSKYLSRKQKESWEHWLNLTYNDIDSTGIKKQYKVKISSFHSKKQLNNLNKRNPAIFILSTHATNPNLIMALLKLEHGAFGVFSNKTGK